MKINLDDTHWEEIYPNRNKSIYELSSSVLEEILSSPNLGVYKEDFEVRKLIREELLRRRELGYYKTPGGKIYIHILEEEDQFEILSEEEVKDPSIWWENDLLKLQASGKEYTLTKTTRADWNERFNKNKDSGK